MNKHIEGLISEPVPRQVVPPTPVKTVKSVKAKVRKIMEAA